jgi:hypothetical protein
MLRPAPVGQPVAPCRRAAPPPRLARCGAAGASRRSAPVSAADEGACASPRCPRGRHARLTRLAGCTRACGAAACTAARSVSSCRHTNAHFTAFPSVVALRALRLCACGTGEEVLRAMLEVALPLSEEEPAPARCGPTRNAASPPSPRLHRRKPHLSTDANAVPQACATATAATAARAAAAAAARAAAARSASRGGSAGSCRRQRGTQRRRQRQRGCGESVCAHLHLRAALPAAAHVRRSGGVAWSRRRVAGRRAARRGRSRRRRCGGRCSGGSARRAPPQRCRCCCRCCRAVVARCGARRGDGRVGGAASRATCVAHWGGRLVSRSRL